MSNKQNDIIKENIKEKYPDKIYAQTMKFNNGDEMLEAFDQLKDVPDDGVIAIYKFDKFIKRATEYKISEELED